VFLFAVGLVFFRGQTAAQCFSLFHAMFTDLHWDPRMVPLLL
jgi:hypothetical protein